MSMNQQRMIARLTMPLRCCSLLVALLCAACASPEHVANSAAPPQVALAPARSADPTQTPDPPPIPDAARILAAMEKVYASCASYHDTGVSTTKIANGPILQRLFKTASCGRTDSASNTRSGFRCPRCAASSGAEAMSSGVGQPSKAGRKPTPWTWPWQR